MRLFYTIPLCFLLIILTAETANSQKAEARLDPEEILPGKPAELIIETEAPAASSVIMPQTLNLGSKIELLEPGQTDTIYRDDAIIQLRQVHRITAWEEGYFAIPPLEFRYVDQGDTLIVESGALLLSVGEVEVDMQNTYRDIKPLFSFPLTWREIVPWLLAVVALVAVSYYLYKRFKNRARPDTPPATPEKTEVPPHIAAISGLESLRRKKLWEKGLVKQYHSELTNIIRKYLEQRFGLNAVEMTTSEIMHAFTLQNRKPVEGSTLRDIMETADLVKFAKYQPAGEKNDRVLEAALEFIKSTIHYESAEQVNPHK